MRSRTTRTVSVRQLIVAIRKLPSDKPAHHPGKWYRTQKQHWLGWLSEYDGPGYYGRKPGMNRDARFAYNHIVEPKMLNWLMSAAAVDVSLVRRARAAASGKASMAGRSAAIRRHVPWEAVVAALWPPTATKRSVPELIEAVRRMPADKPEARKDVWYKTQKEHWLGWLGEYNTSGAYGRIPGKNHTAQFAYNHIANPQMLLWLISAAGVSRDVVLAARRDADQAESKHGAAAAIRKQVPWELVAVSLWPDDP